ncbi:MAG: preprotein translocase subunit SecG [Myxococcales bacterium]
MIFTLVLIVHVIVCLVLFGVILIQQGKGASMGAAFGTGGSQTVFGGSGAGNFLTKTTWVCAILFFSTSLILAYQSSFRRSVVDTGVPPAQTAPAAQTETGKTPAKASKTEKPAEKAAAPSPTGSATAKPVPAPAAPAAPIKK